MPSRSDQDSTRHLIREGRSRSRGKVRCSACMGRIPAGVTYLRQTVRAEGRIFDWLTCPGCEDLMPEIVNLAIAPGRPAGAGELDEWARREIATRGARQLDALAFLERGLAPTLGADP